MKLCVAIAAIAASLAVPIGVAAQATSPDDIARVAVELTFGGSYARTNGEYLESAYDFTSADLIVSLRLRDGAGGSLVAAASVASGITPRDMLSFCRPDGAGGCVQPFPSLVVATALAGWQNAPGIVRVLTGPAVVDSDVASPSFGWQARLELAAILSRHVAAVVGVRGTFVPSHRNDRFSMLSLGVGLRRQ